MKHSIAALPSKGAYVCAWKRLKALSDDARVSVDWMRPNELAADVKRDFRKALDARINLRGGLASANVPIDIGLVRDAMRLADIKVRRIRHYQFESKVCRKRFSHLLADRSE